MKRHPRPLSQHQPSRVGEELPARTRSRVVLPAPFRPASVIRSPASSLKETSANSGLPPTKTSSVVAVAIAIGYGWTLPRSSVLKGPNSSSSPAWMPAPWSSMSRRTAGADQSSGPRTKVLEMVSSSAVLRLTAREVKDHESPLREIEA